MTQDTTFAIPQDNLFAQYKLACLCYGNTQIFDVMKRNYLFCVLRGTFPYPW